MPRTDCKGNIVPEECPDCGHSLPMDVHHSPAGFYLGSICPNCGPTSRESVYFASKKEAEAVLLERMITEGETANV